MRRTVALMALVAVVSHTFARSTYPILLPAIEDDLLANHQQSGLLTSINFGAYSAGVLVITGLSGRFEPAALLRTGVAFAALGFAVLSAADGFTLLALGLGLAGLGSAGIWMTAPAIATGAVGPHRRGTVMGLLSSTMGVGLVFVSQGTNGLRAVLDDPTLWRPTWGAAVVYASVLFAASLVLLRPTSTERVPGGVSLVQLRRVPGWLPLTIAHWCFGFIVSSFTPFFGLALEEAGFGRAHVGNLYALFGLAAAAGAVTLGRVSDRIGRRPVLLGALAAIAAAALLAMYGREPFAAIAAIAFGAASFTFPVLIAAYLSDHLGGRAMTNALGALTLIYGTALILGPVVSGTLGDSALGFRAVFLLVTVLATLAATAVARLSPKSAHDPAPVAVGS